MVIFKASEMKDLIYDIAYDEKTNVEVSTLLSHLLEVFEECRYEESEVEAAIAGTQLFEDSEEMAASTKRFKRVKKERVYEIVIQLAFMYGLAYGENLRQGDSK